MYPAERRLGRSSIPLWVRCNIGRFDLPRPERIIGHSPPTLTAGGWLLCNSSVSALGLNVGGDTGFSETLTAEPEGLV